MASSVDFILQCACTCWSNKNSWGSERFRLNRSFLLRIALVEPWYAALAWPGSGIKRWSGCGRMPQNGRESASQSCRALGAAFHKDAIHTSAAQPRSEWLTSLI